MDLVPSARSSTWELATPGSPRSSPREPAPQIVCWDTGYTPELLASSELRDGKGIQLVVDRPRTSFDLILLLDVLEHVADDRQLLGTLVRENLTAGGHALISVPAWPLLFSSHDVRLHHYRRYTPASARLLIRGAGLEIIRSAGLFHSLILPRALQVARERVTGLSEPPPDVGQWHAPAVVTALVRGLSSGTHAWRSSNRGLAGAFLD